MLRNLNIAALLELAFRWYVFFFLNVYGLGKIAGMQFYRRGALPPEVAQTTLSEASAYDLGWTFMGYSFGYILFIGSAQVLGAWLLLWPRTKLLGVGILLPILFNIIAFDIVFLDRKGALVAALIYTLMLLYVLWFNREKIIAMVQYLSGSTKSEMLTGDGKLGRITILLVLLGVVFLIDQTLVGLAGR